jgi:hypothetical protein
VLDRADRVLRDDSLGGDVPFGEDAAVDAAAEVRSNVLVRAGVLGRRGGRRRSERRSTRQGGGVGHASAEVVAARWSDSGMVPPPASPSASWDLTILRRAQLSWLPTAADNVAARPAAWADEPLRGMCGRLPSGR